MRAAPLAGRALPKARHPVHDGRTVERRRNLTTDDGPGLVARVVIISLRREARAALLTAAGFAVEPYEGLPGDGEAILLLEGESAAPAIAWDGPAVLIGQPDHGEGSAHARGHLDAEATPEEILAALTAVAAGLSVFAPGRLPRGSRPVSETGEPLTERERQVLRAMATGLPNKAIARALGISENTVKYHVAAILSKLGAQSRAEAVMEGVRRGLVAL